MTARVAVRAVSRSDQWVAGSGFDGGGGGQEAGGDVLAADDLDGGVGVRLDGGVGVRGLATPPMGLPSRMSSLTRWVNRGVQARMVEVLA